MPSMHVYKIHVDSVVEMEVDGLDFSTTRVEIKNKEAVVKTLPLNQLLHAVATIQTDHNLHLVFSLHQHFNYGARDYRIFASGELIVSSYQMNDKHSMSMGCSIRNIITKKAVISIAVIIKEDLQKITFSIPDYEPSFLDSEPEDPITTVTSPSPSPRQVFQKKLSPLKRVAKKPVRNRHMQYLVKNESQNFQLNNKVTDEESISVENMKLELDEAISSIQFYGSTYREMLAQVLFKTNPSQDDLKNLRIKVPESQKVIDIQLKTLEGGKLFASTNLPNLQENQCLKISCDFKDENNDVKGKIKFHYKQSTEPDDGNAKKMVMAKEISIFDKNKIKQQLELLPFMFSENKPKASQSPRLKLPKIDKNQPKFELISSSAAEKEHQKASQHAPKPQQQPDNRNRNRSLVNVSSFTHHPQQKKAQDLMPQSKQRIQRSKTIHSRNYIRPPSPMAIAPYQVSAAQKSMLKISGVSVKFYKSFIEKTRRTQEFQPFAGKFLQIYSSSTNIYRSVSVYSNSTLNWKLIGCDIPMSEYDNLNIELNLEKEKTMLGELIISYNQLKFNQEENFLYFGFLTKDYDTIGKICLEFVLMDEHPRDRNSTLEKTERRTRIKRLYSEDIAYVDGDEQYKRQSPNKMSLYQSLAIPTIPEAKHKEHKNRLCQQQKELEMLKEKKRNKLRSPMRRQKYF